jgi:hypothetical protein
MKVMRERRRERGLRELRLIVPDARSRAVRRRVAKAVAGLDPSRAAHASVVVCQMTSACSDAPDCRVTIDPTDKNGLRVRSQVMADKPVTIRRERIGQHRTASRTSRRQ